MLEDDGFLRQVGLPLMMTNSLKPVKRWMKYAHIQKKKKKKKKRKKRKKKKKTGQILTRQSIIINSLAVLQPKVGAKCRTLRVIWTKPEQLYSQFKGTGHHLLRMLRQDLSPFSCALCEQRALKRHLAILLAICSRQI